SKLYYVTATSKSKCRSNYVAPSEFDDSESIYERAACLPFSQRGYFTKIKDRCMAASVILPKRVPVMPLPGAFLFPHALLPLCIFEPRYRKMLKHALAHHRMFCVA